uniref:C2H2-type domain-containing protein n=1 Tax=Mesocestoides corti TaxID=53468 RepID=A0A5K3FGZ5_MESCO
MKRSNYRNDNEEGAPTVSRRKSPPLDIRLPLEMKLVMQRDRSSTDKPALRATCDIPTGHIWGPYRLAGLCRSSSPLNESSLNSAHRQITVFSGDSCELVARVNEENAWIKVIQERVPSEGSNVEIIVEVVPETISVVSLTNISSGSRIQGAVRLVPPREFDLDPLGKL